MIDVKTLVALKANQLGIKSVARARAISVLPTPASPSKKRGRPNLRAKKMGTARGPVGDVSLLSKQTLDFVDRRWVWRCGRAKQGLPYIRLSKVELGKPSSFGVSFLPAV